jgi:DNA polymerase-4
MAMATTDGRTVVLHADADAFFVACHVAERPDLAGRPLVVAGDPGSRHGVVLSASYEARRHGVRNAMPLARARRLFAGLVAIAPDHNLYAAYGRRLAETFALFSPRVERLSIDEAWLDMTGGLGAWGNDVAAAARALKAAVRERVGVTVSVGAAPNKYLAKQASDLDKPDGLCLLMDRAAVERRLWPLPVAALHGCGAKGAARLAATGVRTIGDLARREPHALVPILGSAAWMLVARARGEDATAVAAEVDEPVTVGAERTLAHDVTLAADAEPVLLALADEVAARLRARGLEGRRVVLKYRTAEFRTHTRQRLLAQATAHGPDIYRVLCRLFAERPAPAPVRLLGVHVGDLVPPARQTVLGARSLSALDAALDAIRDRYGEGAIVPARLVRPRSPPRARGGGGDGEPRARMRVRGRARTGGSAER